jgi:hypothetical protein
MSPEPYQIEDCILAYVDPNGRYHFEYSYNVFFDEPHPKSIRFTRWAVEQIVRNKNLDELPKPPALRNTYYVYELGK